MSESSRTNIPKFASFRPKPIPSATDVNREGRQKLEKEDRKLPKSSSHDGRRRRHRSKSREGQHRDHVRPAEKSLTQQPAEEVSNLFFTDRKGDVKNLAYGSLHRYDVPEFHRAGAGNVLGINVNYKIDRDHRDEKSIVLKNRKDFMSKTREKYVFSRVERERPRLLKLRQGAEGEDKDDGGDFVALDLSRTKRKRKEHVAEESSASEDEGNERNYRSIHGKKKTNDEPEDENFRYATDSDSSGSDAGRAVKLDSDLRQKGVELSREVDQTPKDIGAWFALIEHQDTLLHATDRRLTNAEIGSTAEIKIHMYEKALGNITLLSDRERLFAGLMAEGAKIWDLKTRSERWAKVAEDHIDSIALWTSYLNFRQTEFSTFRSEELRKVFIERIKLLKLALLKSPEANHHLYEQLVYVLLRFTVFVRESGFSELAIAIWQGLLEMNFSAPQEDAANLAESFRDFWESEVPRIGEQGSLGWCHHSMNPEEAVVPDVVTDELGPSLDDLDVFHGWAISERARTLSSRNPARTLDEVTEDDPYRVILYSDIEDFLVSFPSESKDLHSLLINAFLVYCQLPVMCTRGPQKEILNLWCRDGFFNGNALDCNLTWSRSNYLPPKVSPDEDGTQNIQNFIDTADSNLSASPTSFFGRSWFRSFRSWREVYGGDNGPVKYDWLRNTLKQLTHAQITESVAEYYLAFEWANEPGSIKKTAKGLLKANPSCLRLYNAYAMIEWSRGHKEISMGVYSAALNMSSSMPEECRKDTVILWKSLTWAHLEEMDNSKTLRYVLSIPSAKLDDQSEMSAATLIKANQYLSANRDYNISIGNTDHAIIYAELLAILEYLTSTSATEPQSSAQGNITSALTVLTHASQTLMARNLTNSAVHEELLQSAARLLSHQARTGPFRPALIRDILTNFLDIFPHNTIFLSLYTWNESRFRIDARVRSLFSMKILRPENDALSSRFFAIRHEINTGTTYSVQAAFENAIKSVAYKSSASLWRLYVIWSCWAAEAHNVVEQKPQERSGVKDVWHRAIQACPWSKEIYMLGMSILRETKLTDFRELKEVGRIMAEKELRIHVDLEEKLEDWEGQYQNTVARHR
ncbi:hypothetical protein PVAG01_02365 [Phlyctema vagabunda]|uniref:DUF1740-domain-containing protein n=1 Tax=Phlyctema vagabunda TaxID=108571 RepID=A0ABR4PQK5_9HELO